MYFYDLVCDRLKAIKTITIVKRAINDIIAVPITVHRMLLRVFNDLGNVLCNRES